MGRNITGLKNPIKKGEEHKGLTRTEIFFFRFLVTPFTCFR